QLLAVSRAQARLAQELGREPGLEELAAESGLEPAQLQALLGFARQQPLSLELPAGEGGTTLAAFVAGGPAEAPLPPVSPATTGQQLRRLLSVLPEGERRLLALRHGLDGEPPRTLEQVGAVFGVSRERIRQRENEALKRLQSLPAAQALRELP